ncbi:MAG: carboxy terminal-processing peptidase [Bacteroidetes bacterium]|nr:carboxy terminal-processing peptidase [Bacteroidota bacterium]
MKLNVFLTFLTLSGILCAQPTSFVGRQSHAILNTVKQFHYKPVAVDDAFSTAVFDSYVEAIDPGGYYFLASDIEELGKYSTGIDDEMESRTAVLFEKSAAIFKTRLLAVDSLLHLLEREKSDLTKDESLSFAPADYPDYADNYTQLKERWRKWLKYAVLDELFTGDYFADAAHESISNLLSKAADAQKAVFGYQFFEIKSYLDHPAGYSNYLATYYLDAIATQFDPHTTYFSDIEKENFEEDLSKENLVFGISVEEDDKGIVRIESVLPGSPAWNSNQLNKGDQVLSLRLSDGQYLEMTTAGIDEILIMFENTTASQLTLEIRKGNGEVLTVELTKGEVYVEEDVLKNLLLVGDQRIGYITLPDFYTDWDEGTGLGCANDVAKCIVKLQKENMQGLILDLRNNGGGSLKEAIDLAGIFIDWGPLAITQSKSGEATSIKDMNKGAIYTGPLVILVNGLSASASELFAAAMQDYNRAIIVGSTTYGKSSSQIILPLDPAYTPGVTSMETADPTYGFLKITTDKFYRVTNATHQRKGVVPNIILPDIYDMYDYKESSYANALSSDSVLKKVYYTPFSAFPDALFESGNQRIAQDRNFSRIAFLIDSINQVNERAEIIPLKIENYQLLEQGYAAFLDELYSLEESEQSPYTATNNLYDLEILKMDAYRRELNEEYLKRVEADAYINQAYLVLIDYLKK